MTEAGDDEAVGQDQTCLSPSSLLTPGNQNVEMGGNVWKVPCKPQWLSPPFIPALLESAKGLPTGTGQPEWIPTQSKTGVTWETLLCRAGAAGGLKMSWNLQGLAVWDWDSK